MARDKKNAKGAPVVEEGPRPPTQLYLITPPIADAVLFTPALEAILDAGEVSTVLLRIQATDDGSAKKIVRDLIPMMQRRGIAVLIEGWSAIIARAGADGIHVVDGRRGLTEALDSFKPERIVGAGGVRSRHDAMVLAETGVDYVLLGEPARDGRTPPLDAVVERTAWWAELFEIPCVAFAPDLAAVPLLADAGADFVALGEAIFNAADPVAAMTVASRVLAQRER